MVVAGEAVSLSVFDKARRLAVLRQGNRVRNKSQGEIHAISMAYVTVSKDWKLHLHPLSACDDCTFLTPVTTNIHFRDCTNLHHSPLLDKHCSARCLLSAYRKEPKLCLLQSYLYTQYVIMVLPSWSFADKSCCCSPPASQAKSLIQAASSII